MSPVASKTGPSPPILLAMSASPSIETSEPPPSATLLEDELSRMAQALADLEQSGSASVSLVHCPSAAREAALHKAMASQARELGFVTATVSMREHGLQSPDALVRQILASLMVPEAPRPESLLDVLERFYDQHGSESAQRFRSAADSVGAHGDLTALCQSYLATDDPEAPAERRAFTAWLDGSLPPKKYRNPKIYRALTERSAQRTLAEFTRIIKVLEYRGLVIFLTEGDSLAERTMRQRERAYTILRELVDNFDGMGGEAVSVRVILTGQDALFFGKKSLRSLAPLAMRLSIPSDAEPAGPHRSWTTLYPGKGEQRSAKPKQSRNPEQLGNLIRIAEGVPPRRAITELSVGQERLDKTIAKLFSLVAKSGRFFSVMVGEYGSGKTHLMLHLAERALEDGRPVFWLNLERTSLDLGNPARHISRFLEHSQMPREGRPSAIAMLRYWTSDAEKLAALTSCLESIAERDDDPAQAAGKALRISAGKRQPGPILERYLGGYDLENRPGDVNYRRDAYRRILLMHELLATLEDIRGPVVLIDEAENLYTTGRPAASRRTALRSLAFYCGGALPNACVILGITPSAFEELRAEARDLLADAVEMESTLDIEDVARFRRSLWRLKPDPVKPLSPAERSELCERVRALHEQVRGPVRLRDWDEQAAAIAKAQRSPRLLIRELVDRLESAWWGS